METKCSLQPVTGPYPEPDYPVHTFPPYFPKLHSNIILPFTPSSVHFRYSYQTFVRISHLNL